MNQATLTSVMVLSFSMCLHHEKQAVYRSYSELVPCKFSGQQQTVNNFTNGRKVSAHITVCLCCHGYKNM